jgi:hypothetical protein
MSNSDERQARRAIIQRFLDDTKARNEAERATRNARRWKEERDPVEYEQQKKKQRGEYAHKIGGPVRSYEKIPATSKAEHKELAKKRDAERQKGRYANLTPAERQAKSDAAAEKAWIERRRNKGVPEDAIQAALIIYLQERYAKRAAKAQASEEEAAMRESPTYGIF